MSALPLHEQLSNVASESVAELERLRRELDLRNCALAAATTHFMVPAATPADCPIVYVNRAICREHGYECEELLGRNPVGLLLDRELNQGPLEELNEAMRFGQPLRTEMQALRKDGSRFWVGFSVAPVFD